ncbi:MAG: histidine phosphatase family protein [Chloroflexota bacterium]
MEIILIRHGQSHVNLPDWQTLDNLDAGLTEKGKQQAEALRDWFKANDHQADVLYTSTMQRTLETTAIIADTLGQKAIHDHRIREIPTVYPTGDIVQPKDIPRTYASDWANKAPFIPRSSEKEGYESWMHFRTRIGQFTDAIIDLHFGQRVYVVAHGGMISAFFDNVFNVGPYRNADVHNYNTSWSRFRYRNSTREPWRMLDFNRIDHLQGKDLL